jgi:hypothetical protein
MTAMSRSTPAGVNVGLIDRIVRIALGVVLITLAFYGPKTPLGWLGLVPLVTGVTGVCPLYGFFGIRTCRSRNAM